MNNELNIKTEKKVRLDNSRHVKRFLNNIINEYNSDGITDLKAKTLSTLINTYTKLLDLEKLDSNITNENEFNFVVSKLNKYLEPSEKKVSIISSLEKPALSKAQFKQEMEMMVHILGGKIIWD